MTQITELNSASSAAGARASAGGVSPRVLGQWHLVSLLGQGALARVFRARPAAAPAERGAHYAVKVLRDRWEDNPVAIGCMQREAAVGRVVSHANLVSVLDAHLAESPRLIVMPYLPGATLAARLTRGQRLSLPLALWVARQVAQALDALHRAGWSHLDVKPSNVIVSAAGHATLLDAGMARRIDDPACVVDRPVLGTLKYIAPELLTSHLAADARSDIYSLGVMLFEMLTGRLPFTGETAGELVDSHRQGIPKNIQALAPQLPPGLVRLVRRMLAKDPLRRPQTAEGLVERLVSLEIETLPQRISA